MSDAAQSTLHVLADETVQPLDTYAAMEVEAPEAPANPLAPLTRAMRPRWLKWLMLSSILGGALGTTGFLTGTQTYESQSILRVHPREQGILFASGDDSVIKTFDSFIKAETAFVASPDVMAHAADMLRPAFPELTAEMRTSDLRGSIEIKRSESLIVLKTKSKDAAFVSAKLDAVTQAYMDLTAARKDAMTEARTEELVRREADLLAQLREIDRRTLEVGGEYGAGAIVKAHVEKIGQIDRLATRKAEVTRTLESMRSSSGAASADMNDEHILRATLLDRGLADLNIEIARHKAELATLRLRYTPQARVVQDKVNQIEILAAAQADRREQIQVLGQTGALTDQTEGGEEESLDAIQSLLEKVTLELDETRAEARDLNARRVELSFLEEERDEARRMLDQTRGALDVIRVESRNGSAGLVEVMSPAVQPDEPAEDSTKMQAAMGVMGGGALATMLMLGSGLASPRLRWSDGLGKASQGLPMLGVLPRGDQPGTPGFVRAMDRLSTDLQLRPGQPGRAAAKTGPLSIAVLRAGPGAATDLARGLAESFGRTELRVLLVDADAAGDAACDRVAGTAAKPRREGDLHVVDAGWNAGASSVPSLPQLRQRLADMGAGFDVVVLQGGSLLDHPSAPLLASISDFAVAELRIGDIRKHTDTALARMAGHPRFGAGLVIRNAHKRDPGLSA